VCDVLKEVGVFSNPKVDLQACHRIGKQGTVITKFTNRKMVTNIMLNKNKLKGRVNGKMYINESLCQLNRKIRGACNSLLKQKRLNKLRSRYGMVSIQINEGEQFILIDHKNILTDNFPDIVLV
jgi:ABC-type histidine transport system ATPase subunit